jgi:hypothetical protein
MPALPTVRINATGMPGRQGEQGEQGPKGDPGSIDGESVLDHGADNTGVADCAAAFAAAAAAGQTLVYIPPGDYLISSLVTFSVANQCIRFAPGATLKINPSGGSVVFSGAQQRIEGLRYSITTGASTTFAAVTVSGAGTVVDGIRADLSADVPNCDLFKISGEAVHVSDVRLTSTGKAFRYGVYVATSGGAAVNYVTVGKVFADVGDDGANCTFGALVYARSRRSEWGQIAMTAGGRAYFPDGVVIVDEHFNTFNNPAIAAPKAAYGFNILDGAEQNYISGGWVQAAAGSGWIADSEGVRIGHNSDHTSLDDVTLTGWDYGLGIHGSNNIINLRGLDTSNNQTAGILLDSNVGGTDYPVSGLTMTGCYGENAAGQPVYLWAKSGLVLGCTMLGCTFGYNTYGVKIENAGFYGVTVEGCKIIAADISGEIFKPNATTDVFFGKNYIGVSNTIATGPNAARIRTAVDSSTTALTLSSLTLGSGSALTKYFSDFYTANFGTVPANSEVVLEFSFSGIAVTDALFITYQNALYAKAGITYKSGIPGANKFGITARNHTGSDVTSVSGDVRVSVLKH